MKTGFGFRVSGFGFILGLLTCPGTWNPAPVTAAGNGGTTAAEFLRVGTGWPVGMSEAGASVVQDATALHWNPAGIARNGSDLYLSHASYPESLSYDSFFGSLHLENSWVGYSLQVLRQDPIDRLDNTGADQGSFRALDMAHTLGYAVRQDNNRYGGSIRFINQSIDGASGSAFALGLGFQRKYGNTMLGTSVNNLGTRIKLRKEEYPLPLTIRTGSTWAGGHNDDLLLASDVSWSKGVGARLHLGIAHRVYHFREVPAARAKGSIALRAGYATNSSGDSDGPSGLGVGAGISYNSFRTDFTYQPFGAFGNAIHLGLGLLFK